MFSELCIPKIVLTNPAFFYIRMNKSHGLVLKSCWPCILNESTWTNLRLHDCEICKRRLSQRPTQAHAEPAQNSGSFGEFNEGTPPGTQENTWFCTCKYFLIQYKHIYCFRQGPSVQFILFDMACSKITNNDS